MEKHSNILAWKIRWTEEHGTLQSMGLQESDITVINTYKCQTKSIMLDKIYEKIIN